jgi:hypothetical protein
MAKASPTTKKARRRKARRRAERSAACLPFGPGCNNYACEKCFEDISPHVDRVEEALGTLASAILEGATGSLKDFFARRLSDPPPALPGKTSPSREAAASPFRNVLEEFRDQVRGVDELARARARRQSKDKPS